jgi:uncharacterized protein (DUF3820 family)
MDGFTMPFGKYQHKPLAEVPSDYLRWLTRACRLRGSLRIAVAKELSLRGLSAPAPTLVPEPTCSTCGGAAMSYRWQEDSIGRLHIQRSCARCGRWCGFASTELFAQQANAAEAEGTVSTVSQDTVRDAATRLRTRRSAATTASRHRGEDGVEFRGDYRGGRRRCGVDRRPPLRTNERNCTMSEFTWTFEDRCRTGGWVRLPESVREASGSPVPFYFKNDLWCVLDGDPAVSCAAVVAAAEAVGDDSAFPNETPFQATIRGREFSLAYEMMTDDRGEDGVVYGAEAGRAGSDLLLAAMAVETARRYGVDPAGMSIHELYDRVEELGNCDVESVCGAVLVGMDYPVTLPGEDPDS